MNKQAQQIWDEVQNGKLPPGTTAKELAACVNEFGKSALHTAAEKKLLPPNTTVQDLAQCKTHDGISALHYAAANDNLPYGTTADDLAQCEDNEGWSALHTAASQGRLPPDATITTLQNTKPAIGLTAWDCLLSFAETYPTRALTLPNALFATNHDAATELANKIIKADATLASAAAIWLAHVIAKTNPTKLTGQLPPPTIPA